MRRGRRKQDVSAAHTHIGYSSSSPCELSLPAVLATSSLAARESHNRFHQSRVMRLNTTGGQEGDFWTRTFWARAPRLLARDGAASASFGRNALITTTTARRALEILLLHSRLVVYINAELTI